MDKRVNLPIHVIGFNWLNVIIQKRDFEKMMIIVQVKKFAIQGCHAA